TVADRENAAKIIEPMGFVRNFEEVDNLSAVQNTEASQVEQTVNEQPVNDEPVVKQEPVQPEVKEKPKETKQAPIVRAEKPKAQPAKENNSTQGHQIKQSL